MNSAAYSKTLENLHNRIDGRLLKNKKDYLTWISTPSYISVFYNNFVTISKNKVTLTLNKPLYVGMF